MQKSGMTNTHSTCIASFILPLLMWSGIINADVNVRSVPEQQLAHDIYKQFIEIPSGFSTGPTTPIAAVAAARLKAAGFPAEDIFIGGATPEKGNLVVRYHGTGERKPILLLAHIDVVEAKREDWTTDPFKLVEKDGYFYGRGTSDDKAQAAIWIANLIQFKREGFKPDRDIIVALTADEEGGGPYNGVEWLLKNHPDLINADFALNEGGWGELVNGRKISNHIQISEKNFVNFRFEVHNKGGHSSMPVADNAIYHLADALQRLSKFNFPLKTNAITATYFKQSAKLDAGPNKQILAQASTGSPEALKKVAAVSPMWNATLRTTCVPTMLEGGHARNALPQLAVANINCRLLPEDSTDYVLTTLQKVVDDNQVTIVKTEGMTPGPSSPLRSDVMSAVTASTNSIWPNVPVVAIMVTGATDGRYLRAAGIPTYGVQGLFSERDDIRAHGRDERLRMESFYEGQAFLYDLVKRLSTA